MKINSQFSIDLTATGVQVFDAGDSDSLWFPDAYITPSNYATTNPTDALVCVWLGSQSSQPLLMGCRTGAIRSISGSRIGKVFVQILNYTAKAGGDNTTRLVFGTGTGVRVTFASPNSTDQLPLYVG